MNNIDDSKNKEFGSSVSREDRIYLLKIKLIDALKNKNDHEIVYYSKLLSMYENNYDSSNELTAFLKNKGKKNGG